MSQEIKSYASQISELMFDNTDKIPEGVYLEVMNKLKKVVDVANDDTIRIKYQNIDFRDKYNKENTKNNLLTAGLLHTMFKPIETNPNLSKYDFIDSNYCLNVRDTDGNYTTHLLTDILSVEFEDFYDLDTNNLTIKSFITTTCLRGKMLCLYTSYWQTTEGITRLNKNYIGNYYVGDLLHYEYCFKPENQIHSSVDVFIRIHKLNKKNMLVDIHILVRNNELQIENTIIKVSKQEKVHMEYYSLSNITKIVPDELTLGYIPAYKIFNKYLQTENQETIEQDFILTFKDIQL